MGNTLTGLIPVMYQGLDIVAREMTGFIPSVSIDSEASTAAVGQTITIHKAPAAASRNIVPGVTPQNDGDQVIPPLSMTITKSKGVPIRWNGDEQKGVGGQYGKILADQFAQAVRTLVNEVETDLAALAITTSRAYGIAGTTPFVSDVGDMAQIRKIMVDNGCPMSDCSMVMNTSAGANLRTLYQLTKVNEAGSADTLRRGTLLDLHGFAMRESGQAYSHTAGTANGAYLTNLIAPLAIGAVDIAVDTGAGTIVAGDTLTFAGDPNIYVVETALAAGTLSIAAPGLRQALADGVAVTVNAGYSANVAFHRSALQLLARTPAMPVDATGKAIDMADDVTTIVDPFSGLAFQVAVYKQYRQIQYEVGLAWGVKNIKTEFSALLLG